MLISDNAVSGQSAAGKRRQIPLENRLARWMDHINLLLTSPPHVSTPHQSLTRQLTNTRYSIRPRTNRGLQHATGRDHHRPLYLSAASSSTDQGRRGRLATTTTMFKPTQALFRRYRRLRLTTKDINKGFYKGTRTGRMGQHNKWGGFSVDYNLVRTYAVPPGLDTFKVRCDPSSQAHCASWPTGLQKGFPGRNPCGY